MAGIIVEDEHTFMTKFITEMLRREGYQVRTVEHVTADLAAEKPDLIIMYLREEVIPGIRQLAIMRRSNSFIEALFRRAGVCCIQDYQVVEIVDIVRDFLHIPK